MEPMALGSAPSSPTSNTNAPGFLPCYLMGQHETSTPKQVATSNSPRLNRNLAYNLSTAEEVAASPIIKQRLFGAVGPDPPLAADPSPNNNKPGPPRQSLFDTIDITRHGSPSVINNESALNFNTSYSLNTSQAVPYDNVNTWVTVFGFGSESLASILAMFSKCGTIVDKRIPSQGNWINIKFSTKSEAIKALSLNGKVVGNSVMIGVAPYFERQSDKENIDTSRTMYSSPGRIRSLKHSFVSPHSSDSVLPMQNVPQKSTSIVTKAMEYVFGW